MRIQSVRSNLELPEMVFERIKIKLERKKEDHWDHTDRKAA
jgi:hypothetical protein